MADAKSSITMIRHGQRRRCRLLIGLCAIPGGIKAASMEFPGTLPHSYGHPQQQNESASSRFATPAGSSDDDEEEHDKFLQEESSDYEEDDVLSDALTDSDMEGAASSDDDQPIPYADDGEESSASTDLPGSSSQPLKTLEKLQHMLDSTDYMTVSPSHPDAAAEKVSVESWSDIGEMDDKEEEPESIQTQPLSRPSVPESTTDTRHTASKTASKVPPPQQKQLPPSKPEQLWTSKDRSKYKKQQMRSRIEQRKSRQQRRTFPSPPIHPNSSDDDMTDDETEGDGLGYTLPNLPVYYTDDEGGTTTDGFEIAEPPRQTAQPQQQQMPHQQQQYHPYNYPNPPYPYPDQAVSSQPPPYYPLPPSGSYQMPYPYGSYNLPQQQPQQVHAAQQQQQAAAWGASTSLYGPPLHPPWSRSRSSYHTHVPPTVSRRPTQTLEKEMSPKTNAEVDAPTVDSKISLAEVGTMVNFDSIQKLCILMIGVILLCYCAVSPRTLELVQYNQEFKQNIGVVSLVFIAPIVNFLCVFDARENDVNAVVSTLYLSTTAGYIFVYILEVVLTTMIRLGVFVVWEPNVFELTPKVPILVLPWVLRENKYRPKRITLFAADFVTSCVAAPIVEEYIKLKILQLSIRLPKNFKWTTKKSVKKKGRKKRRVAEPIQKGPGETDVVNINSYVTEMLAASLGIKLLDAVRRILMYTKSNDLNRSFYSFCRGIFPIHELCGTMTALNLAKRDVLGVEMPLWRILAPAVVIHGMANFKGMKPIFKWNSATPWSEMQLSPWNVADDSTFSQLLSKGFAKLMWLIVLGRVLGYCVKNYYLIGRQAKKRTTTYAGKHAAFTAELEAGALLKKSKEK